MITGRRCYRAGVGLCAGPGQSSSDSGSYCADMSGAGSGGGGGHGVGTELVAGALVDAGEEKQR